MVPDPETVTSVLDDAVAAGATLVTPATTREWGGVTGYFADPDGYRWEVAYNPSTGPGTTEILGVAAATARIRAAREAQGPGAHRGASGSGGPALP
jgi:hypothetical protein